MPRVVAVGAPHHITQRGNARQDIFLNDSLCRVYLGLLRQHARAHRLRILAYCLMTNHIHLVAVPEHDAALAGALRHTHGRFSQYWNTQLHRDGHLWQNRFYSCPVEDVALWRVIAYVERNPLRAQIVARAGDYPWSSASAHLRGEDSLGLLDLAWWRRFWQPPEWSAVLAGPIDETAAAGAELLAIRRATYTGRPFDSPAFIEELGRRLGRGLERRRGGRPRKGPVPAEARQAVQSGTA
jgi:putative transposase